MNEIVLIFYRNSQLDGGIMTQILSVQFKTDETGPINNPNSGSKLAWTKKKKKSELI